MRIFAGGLVVRKSRGFCPILRVSAGLFVLGLRCDLPAFLRLCVVLWRAVAAFLWGCAAMRLHFCRGALCRLLAGCRCISLGLRCDAPAFLWGCAEMRLHFCGGALCRLVRGCGCNSAWVRCDVPAFLWGCAAMRLHFCGGAPCRLLAGRGGISAELRCVAAAFLQGCAVTVAGGPWLHSTWGARLARKLSRVS